MIISQTKGSWSTWNMEGQQKFALVSANCLPTQQVRAYSHVCLHCQKGSATLAPKCLLSTEFEAVYMCSHFISPPHGSRVTTVYAGQTTSRRAENCLAILTKWLAWLCLKYERYFYKESGGRSSNQISCLLMLMHACKCVFSSVVPASGEGTEWKLTQWVSHTGHALSLSRGSSSELSLFSSKLAGSLYSSLIKITPCETWASVWGHSVE